MRIALAAAAVTALVLIGTIESGVSNEQLAQLPGRARPAVTGAGTALTFVGAIASLVVYAALGWLLARAGTSERRAVLIGALVALGAGLVGGAIRAYLVSDYMRGILAGFGMDTLLGVVLGMFVALSVLVSVAAGTAMTWVSFRRSRRRGTTPLPS